MTSDLQAVAQTACEEIGVLFRSVPADGCFHYLDAAEKARHNGAGRIKLFTDGSGGMVWNHSKDDGYRLFWANDDQTLTPSGMAERKQRAKEERERAEQELTGARQRAAKLAQEVWRSSEPPTGNPYLLRKMVIPTYTLRQIKLDTLVKIIGYHPKVKGEPITGEKVLIVPVKSDKGMSTIEMIDAMGRKPSLADGQKKGCFWSTGKLPDEDNTSLVIGIGEGVATMLTYQQATGCIGIAALTCTNLTAVAQFFRHKYPNAKILIISDVGNGEQAAIEAARDTNSMIVKPQLPEGSTGSDINDLHNESGLESVRACIEAAVMPGLTPVRTEIGNNKVAEWQEPLPLPDGLPSVKPLDPVMIPLPLRGWLMDIANRMQIPPDFSTAAAVVALGAIIGRGCGIYPKRHDDWLVVSNIWGAVVGRPSLMKTPAVSEAQRHLNRLEAEARDDYQIAADAFGIDKEIMKITKAAICEEIKKSAKAGNDIVAVRGKLAALQVNEPIRRRYQTQDGTTEKIGELLIESPRGLLVKRDELIGWFRSLDRDGREGDRAFYLEAWNGNQGFTYDRIGRGTLDIPALCVSIFGAITPGPLSSYVYQANRGGNGDDGLLQRFQVFVWPDAPTEWNNIDRFPDTAEKNRAWNIFRALSGDIPGAVMENGAEIPGLRFSPGGQDVFDTWRQDLETRLLSDHGLHPAMESHLTKYRKLMPALALIFHLVDVADGKATGQVSELAALMAAAWCDYLESHAGRIYGAATMPGMEAAREIIKHIRRGAIQNGCKPKDIYKNQWSKLATPEEAKSGLEVLEEYDWLTVDKIITGGRPSEIITLNPHIKL